MTTDTLTLTAFLLARIEEDEAHATAAATADRWWVDGPAVNSGKHWVYETGEKFSRREIAEHIARHDPSRILAECTAKRAVLELHSSPLTDLAAGLEDLGEPWESISGDSTGLSRDQFKEHRRTLRVLAAVYADHESYRAEWAT